MSPFERWIYRRLGIVFLCALVLCFAVVFGVYLRTFGGPLSNDHQRWSEFGGYVGGVFGPLVAVIGLLALYLTFRANAAATRAQLFAVSQAQFAQVELLLRDIDGAMRFHGISNDDLKAAGIDHKELGYLAANFAAGSIIGRSLEDAEILDEKDKEPFTEGSYYWMMLSQEATRRAWIHALNKMFSESAWKSRIWKTIKIIEEAQRLAAGLGKGPS